MPDKQDTYMSVQPISGCLQGASGRFLASSTCVYRSCPLKALRDAAAHGAPSPVSFLCMQLSTTTHTLYSLVSSSCTLTRGTHASCTISCNHPTHIWPSISKATQYQKHGTGGQQRFTTLSTSMLFSNHTCQQINV